MSEEITAVEPEVIESASLLGGSGPVDHGDRPEYIPEKFWSAEAGIENEKMANSYNELEKKFGGFTGAPKDGYNLPEGVESDDALAVEFINMAKDLNMSQAGFDKGFELFSTQMGVNQEVSQEAEIAKLGDNASQRIATLESALKNKLGEGYNEVKDLITNADSIILAETLMKAYTPAKLPIDGGEHPQGLTWSDIEVEMFKKDSNGRLLRSTDSAHNAKVERMMQEFGGSQSTRVVVG